MSRRSGVTLAEILTCILILMVLAAVLFPIFAQTVCTVRAPSITCLSNMKQLGTGLQMYLQDNDGFFPPKNTGGAASGGDWDDQLSPYVGEKNDGIFQCPGAEIPPPDRLPASVRVRHVAFNANLYGRRIAEDDRPAAKSDPAANLITFCEVHYRVRELSEREYRIPIAVIGPDFADVDAEDGWKPLGEPGATRHQGGSNYGFADGHAKWLRSGKVRDGRVPAFGDGTRPGFDL